MSLIEVLRKPAVQIAGAVILPNIGGFVNGAFIMNDIKNWYQGLKFPSFRPPDSVFGPVWTALYSGMGYASYVVYKKGGGFSGPARFPLMLYGAQLALNWAWTPLFFKKKDLKLSSFEIVALTAAAGSTCHAFFKIDRTAGLIMVPYIAWLAFASCLNISLYKLNKDKSADDEKNK